MVLAAARALEGHGVQVLIEYRAVAQTDLDPLTLAAVQISVDTSPEPAALAELWDVIFTAVNEYDDLLETTARPLA